MLKTSLQNVFSIKNDNIHKVITICGIKIKIKSKLKALEKTLQSKEKQLFISNDEKNCLLKNFINFMPKSTSNKVYLLNDTSRENNHIGCQITQKNIIKLCNKYDLKICFFDSTYPIKGFDTDNYKKIVSNCDLLLLNGEGTLHDSAGVSLFEKCRIAKEYGKKVILINTVWQNNQLTEQYLKYFDLIACRESISYSSLPEKFRHNAIIVPDLTFYNGLISDRKNQTKLVFTDSVIPEITNTLKSIANKYQSEFLYLDSLNHHENILTEEYIANLTKNSIIVTGRFHALTLGIKYGVPTYAIPSNSHKIEGLLKDSNLEDYLINYKELNSQKIEEIMQTDKSSFFTNSQQYCIEANKKIENLYETIALLVSKESI